MVVFSFSWLFVLPNHSLSSIERVTIQELNGDRKFYEHKFSFPMLSVALYHIYLLSFQCVRGCAYAFADVSGHLHTMHKVLFCKVHKGVVFT